MKLDTGGACMSGNEIAVDIDGDGRKELVLAMRFPTVRTIVVYTASESSQRLELAGEAPSFAK